MVRQRRVGRWRDLLSCVASSGHDRCYRALRPIRLCEAPAGLSLFSQRVRTVARHEHSGSKLQVSSSFFLLSLLHHDYLTSLRFHFHFHQSAHSRSDHPCAITPSAVHLRFHLSRVAHRSSTIVVCDVGVVLVRSCVPVKTSDNRRRGCSLGSLGSCCWSCTSSLNVGQAVVSRGRDR